MATIDSLDYVFQALADPTRRTVIQRLSSGPASTSELAEPFEMALPSFMQHLKVLEDSGLVTSQKVGRVRTWQLKQAQLEEAESWIHEQRAVWFSRMDNLATYVQEIQQKRDSDQINPSE